MHIKKAHCSADYQCISILAKEIWQEHYTPLIGEEQVSYMLRKFQSPESIAEQVAQGTEYFMGFLENASIAYLSTKLEGSALFLGKLYVLKKHRGQGFSRSALEYVETRAKDVGATRIYLTVNKGNMNSIARYEKLRFGIVKPILQDIGDGFYMDDYMMEKGVKQ